MFCCRHSHTRASVCQRQLLSIFSTTTAFYETWRERHTVDR